MVNMSEFKKLRETATDSSENAVDSTSSSMLDCQLTPSWFHHVTTIKIDYGVIHMLECQSSLDQESVMKMNPIPALRGEQEWVDIGDFIMKVQFSAPTSVISGLSTEEQEQQRNYKIQDCKIYTLAISVSKLEDPASFKMGRKQGFRLVQKDKRGNKRVLFIQLPPSMNPLDHVIVHYEPNDINKIVYMHVLFPPEYFSNLK